MKNALILHGTDASPKDNWFWWLKTELEQKSWQVWVPQLPNANKPNIRRYNQLLFQNPEFTFSQESMLVGHSSGAVAILGLLQAMPKDMVVDSCYLVGAFKDSLGWDALNELFTDPFNFDYIRTKAKKFVFIHSDNDPYCPLEHAEYLSEKLNGELIIQPGQKHFSIGTAGDTYQRFPFLLSHILQSHKAGSEYA